MASSFISLLRTQYFSLYPTRSIVFPSTPSIELASNQSQLVSCLLDDEVLKKHQPAKDYQRKFWKRVVEKLVEEELRIEEAVLKELELDERILEHYFALMSTSSTHLSTIPETSHKTYIYNSPHPFKRRRLSRISAHGPTSLHPIETEHLQESRNVAAMPLDDEADNSSTECHEQMITLLEAQTTIEAGSTGLRTWTASLHLATLLLHDSTLLHNPSASHFPDAPLPPILELGSGTGFLSMFLAQMGCPKIWATDLGDDDMDDDGILDDERGSAPSWARRGPLDTLIHNLELNRERLPNPVIPVRLDWFDALRMEQHSLQKGQISDKNLQRLSGDLPEELVIVAADVIYDPDLILPLVACLAFFLRPRISTDSFKENRRFALVAATVRNESTIEAFIHCCADYGLGISQVPSPALAEEGEVTFWNANAWEGQEVKVMRITMRR